MSQTPPQEVKTMDLEAPLKTALHEITPGDKIYGSVVLAGFPPDEFGNARFAFYVQGTGASRICNTIIGLLNKIQEGGAPKAANDEAS